MSAIFGGCAAEAAACAACLVLSSWYLWELSYVEKKALKVKRRRHHRKNRCGGRAGGAGRGGVPCRLGATGADEAMGCSCLSPAPRQN